MNKPTLDNDIRHMLTVNLRSLRKKHKLSQFALAERLEVEQKRVGSWEEQRAAPPLYVLVKISNDFNVDLKEFLTKELFVKSTKKRKTTKKPLVEA